MPKPSARLTTTYIGSLRPGETPRDVGDPAVRGLLLRVWPWGTKNWLFRYTWKKAAVRISLGNFPERSVHEAHELALQYRGLLKRGIDPRTADRTLDTRAASAKPRRKDSAGVEAALFPMTRAPDEFDTLL